jgi:(p)ppGpp synthase/HD superfamily hydrolase
MSYESKINFLENINANDKSHSGKTLIDHLVGVHDILKEWDAPQYLQDAGLFHSVYGTAVFKHQSTNDRDAVKKLIG